MLVDEIKKLKEEKNAVIMAHYYVPDEVQEIADYIGDSYYLSDMATKIDAKVIVLCGVKFMGESAKVLNPDKVVLLPSMDADCPMAHMASVEDIQRVRQEYDDVAVVCYVNSTATLKANSDVCVTSANALKIVKALPNKNIFFIPDQNLAHFIADKLPEKNFIYNDGYCHVHHNITLEDIKAEQENHPKAKLLVHPECKPEVTACADYIGSTSGIIKYATEDDCEEYIVCTEMGVMYELRKRNPHKKFYGVGDKLVCTNMKKVTLEAVYQVLSDCKVQVEMEEDLITKAHKPMLRMLELSN